MQAPLRFHASNNYYDKSTIEIEPVPRSGTASECRRKLWSLSITVVHATGL